jgi:Class III cytochrome C family.
LFVLPLAWAKASAVEAPVTTPVEAPEEAREMNWTRRPVVFSHQVHAKALAGKKTNDPHAYCARCHHPVNGETPYLTCASPECHDNLNQKDKSVQSYYLATHKKKKETFYSCISCHEEQAGDDIAAMKRLAGCKQSACHP